MTNEDKARGAKWYLKHKEHVDRLIARASDAYEPSSLPYRMGGDAHDPGLWKPEHWRWFLTNQPSQS